MVELLRNSPHQPVEVVNVPEHKVDVLLATGKYEKVDGAKKEEQPKKEDIYFSAKMTEKAIKEKIDRLGIDIDYKPSRDRKAEVLEELETMGYTVNQDE